MSRIHSVLPALGAALGLAAAPLAAQFPSQADPVRAVPVVEGLQDAWSMAWLPNGDMLVTEQPGRLRVVRNGALQPEPISGVPAVRYQGQGGLLDVAVHPDFASNQLVYLSFSKPGADGAEGTTAVVRGRLEGNALQDVQEIFEANAWSRTPGHYGSRLAFDGAGFLFVTVGDRMAPPTGDLAAHPAQDLTNHQGTVNRIHDDGRVPEDNPFVDRPGAMGSIWSYGHRSPQGLAINPQTGEIWQSEHGPQGGDELNLIQRGSNYGWPVIGYGVNYGGAPLHAERQREGMEQPRQFFTPSIGTTGLIVYTGDRYPEWTGNVFMGGMVGQSLVRIPILEGGQVGRVQAPLLMGIGRIRDVRQGPDGYIYLAVENRRGDGTSDVVRLEPTQTTLR